MNSTDKRIAIVGTGGHAREVLCLIRDIYGWSPKVLAERVAFVSETLTEPRELNGSKVVGESDLSSREFDFVIGIGDPVVRKRVANRITSKIPGAEFPNLIHPSCVLSPWIRLGRGNLIAAGCILTCNIEIENHVHLNRRVDIGHDVTLHDYVSIAPGAVVSGNCEIGECSYLGANSCVRQGLGIAKNVTVGMGAVVVKDLTESGVYVGVPAKRV
jgi:sugar O-acyltransferase (sialic acid O-acetyltransferase NeuD family)